MPELLLEIGCEELPASYITPAAEQLRDKLLDKLATVVEDPNTDILGTPRRMIVRIANLRGKEEDSVQAVRGPSVKAAYDAEGNPTKALEGFCRGQGLDVAKIRTEGDYVWGDKFVAGRDTSEMLATVLPEVISSLTFPKSMRWGSHRLRFARPIRWLLAVFDGKAVPFTITDVESGIESRGHRINHPGPLPALSLAELTDILRQHEVEPEISERVRMIQEGCEALLSGTGLSVLDLDGEIALENAQLTEWPQVLVGEFDESYLTLPEFVLKTVMIKHERFFPVVNGEGKLVNKFVSVYNSGEPDTVREGNRWVLGCRFNDAKFFFDEDRKKSIESFLEATKDMVFQEKLGTVLERSKRLSKLAASIAGVLGGDAETQRLAAKAGELSKFDLTTGLVGDLAETQGLVGGCYARFEGVEEEVCQAIERQYLRDDAAGDSTVSLSLRLADNLDKLAGYLGIGQIPSGTSDAFGLRRSVSAVISYVLANELDIDLAELISLACAEYEAQDKKFDVEAVKSAFSELLRQRYGLFFDEYSQDQLEAVLAASETVVFKPNRVRTNLVWVKTFAADEVFVQTATRPANLLASVAKKGIAIGERNDDKLDSEEGTALASVLVLTESAESLESLRMLIAPLNHFFDNTMIMVEDEVVRAARLALLKSVHEQFCRVADFSKLVQVSA